MVSKKKLSVLLIIGLGFFSCKGKLDFSKQKSDDEKIIVQYREHFLTDRDIRLILPQDVAHDDSIKIVKAYIEEWVKKKAIVDKAEENIDELTLKEIDNKMVEYRQDLLINSYNNYLIEKNLKDSVSEADIEAYFEEHKSSFPLSKDIIRFRSITVDRANEKTADKLFNSGLDEDFDDLMKIVLSNGFDYHDKDSIWYSTDALTTLVPELNSGDYLNQVLNRRRVKIVHDSLVTMVRILNLKTKGTEAPLDFVKPTIKNLLLNKRKLNLLVDLQKDLYKEAINKNEIKINEK